MNIYFVEFDYGQVHYTDTISADTPEEAIEIAADSLRDMFLSMAEATKESPEPDDGP